MAVRLGDTAPDFTADTTEGTINFHEWLGDSWGVLFSHPKDFTPVCTTELGAFSKAKAEFDKRNTKLIGLSVDAVELPRKWAGDIEETQGQALNFPLIGDEDRKVADLYDMIHLNVTALTRLSLAALPGFVGTQERSADQHCFCRCSCADLRRAHTVVPRRMS